MVGPLDSQIVINQSPATEKVQEVQQRHPDLQQKHFALRLNEEQEKRQRDVSDTEKLDQALIQNREGRDKRKRRKARRNRSGPEETSDFTDDEREEMGGRVDVFV